MKARSQSSWILTKRSKPTASGDLAFSRGALGCCRACINESKAVTKSGCCAGFREALGVRTRPRVAFKKQYSISRFTRYGNVATMKAMRGRIALPKHFVRNLDARPKKSRRDFSPARFLLRILRKTQASVFFAFAVFLHCAFS
jgi:hypothetical protein